MMWMLFLSFSLQAQTLSGVRGNNTAVDLLNANRNGESTQVLSDVLVSDPKQAEVHYNLGEAYARSEDKEEKVKAAQSYLYAAQLTTDEEMKFQAYFNAGHVLGEAEKIEEALEAYQKALDLRPDSIEVKTNIELLFQQQKGGGGGGGNQNQDKKENKDQQQQQQQQKPEPNKDQSQSKPTPRPFKSEQLNPQDARRILDELKRQEQEVRARFMEKQNQKETPVDKDW